MPLNKPRPLQLVFEEKKGAAASLAVTVALALDSGGRLSARFEVSGQPSRVNAALPTDGPQWGLWDWDVVELFVAASKEPTYHEFQVSPLGQHFELEIFEPRKRFNRDFRSGFTHSATRTADDRWSAQLAIDLSKLGWTGERADVRGNAFAILGAPGAKTYWSLSTPPQAKPDFHLPEHFKPLC
ncbi:MAG: hypothetical protein HY075_03035 [Deltaproteobacteria bacterium]|nr:hypothetical protein [Deltaproteobacteria bacterium]